MPPDTDKAAERPYRPKNPDFRRGHKTIRREEPPRVYDLPCRRTINIRLRFGGRIMTYDCGDLNLDIGDWVVVKDLDVLRMGLVTSKPVIWPADQEKRKVLLPSDRRLIRAANQSDIARQAENQIREREAYEYCQSCVAHQGLVMKLVAAEITFDNFKTIFYYTSEDRVDFRQLVKELVTRLRTRIEMRQIGVRNEALMLGGVGICGRPFCCAGFLSSFSPVSVRMAKEQNVSLNTSKLSGVCGRLMCCLAFENYNEQTAASAAEEGDAVPEESGEPMKTVATSRRHATARSWSETPLRSSRPGPDAHGYRDSPRQGPADRGRYSSPGQVPGQKREAEPPADPGLPLEPQRTSLATPVPGQGPERPPVAAGAPPIKPEKAGEEARAPESAWEEIVPVSEELSASQERAEAQEIADTQAREAFEARAEGLGEAAAAETTEGALSALGQAAPESDLSQTMLGEAGQSQAGLPQAGLPETVLPQAGLPEAGLPQASLPQASLTGPLSGRTGEGLEEASEEAAEKEPEKLPEAASLGPADFVAEALASFLSPPGWCKTLTETLSRPQPESEAAEIKTEVPEEWDEMDSFLTQDSSQEALEPEDARKVLHYATAEPIGEPAPALPYEEDGPPPDRDPDEETLSEAKAILDSAIEKAWSTADSLVKAFAPPDPLDGLSLQLGRDFFLEEDEDEEAEAAFELEKAAFQALGPGESREGALEASQAPPSEGSSAKEPRQDAALQSLGQSKLPVAEGPPAGPKPEPGPSPQAPQGSKVAAGPPRPKDGPGS